MILLLACMASEPPLPPPGPMGPPPEAFYATPSYQLEPGSGEHHNILVVSLDTVRADSLSPWGGPVQGFPGDAVVSNAISAFPQTCLSHWTLLSGVLPALHGNTPGNRGSLWPGPTLAELAKKEGFATGAFIGGQTLVDNQCGLSRGFDTYDDAFPFNPQDMRRHGREVIGSAQRWIRQQKGSWFAFVHLFDAHFPYTPESDRFDGTYRGSINGDDSVLRPYRDGDKTPSAEDITHVRALYDSEIAELSDWLKPLWNVAGEDTLVLITADHGESFEHGYWFNHKDSLRDGVMHVPLLLSGPGVESGRLEGPMGLIDVTPTLATLAGLPLDRRMQGRPFGSAAPLFSITDPWDPNGTHQFAERSNGQLRLSDPKGTRCFSWPGDEEQACVGEDHRQDYQDSVEALRPQMVEGPTSVLPMTPEECRRLEALGYVECEG